jgi:hypothetical protein
MELQRPTTNCFPSILQISLRSTLDLGKLQKQALEQVEWAAAEKAIDIYWDGVYKGCDLIPDVPPCVDAGKVVCKSASHIVRIVLGIVYFAAHVVSTD